MATEKKHKLDLSRTLQSIDYRDKEFYKNLTDEEKKAYAPLVLMRFMSSAPDQNNLHAYFVQAINEIVNVDFWTLSKHPQLQHQLMCLAGIGKKQFHSWIAGPKRTTKNAALQFIRKINPQFNNQECQLQLKLLSQEELKNLCLDHALEDHQIKEILKSAVTKDED